MAMRLAQFESDRRRRLALVSGEENETIIDLNRAAELRGGWSDAIQVTPDELMTVIRSPDIYAALSQFASRMMSDEALPEARIERSRLRWCAPIERPGKIICLAGNYREHIAESGFAVPRPSDLLTPQLFLKPATTIIGDGEDILLGSNNERVGWEVELAVIIGKRGRDISAAEADDHIFGYTILNDISERRLNARIPARRESERDKFFDWLAGKWFDTFAPCGPWVVTRDEIGDPHRLEIKLSVNGQLRQQGNTGEMIHRIPKIIAYVSSVMTLEPGDIISTGTPVGAGVGGAATSLSEGDEVVCEIGGIGVLRNRVRSIA
jgi:2-keto-4-pentenoate hydratase/2-oxohepta-3-ene-1,7-dioic acid hydratase in catechol pathway